MNENVTQMIPLLPVADLTRTLMYYQEIFRCGIEWNWEDQLACVSRDGVSITFSKEANPAKITCFIKVGDLDKVYNDCRTAGVKIVDEPQTKPWQLREFTVVDNNGHQFRIFSST